MSCPALGEQVYKLWSRSLEKHCHIWLPVPYTPNVFLPPCYSYYGLIVWFPDMIRYLQEEAYESRVKIFDEEEVSHFTFNFTLENQIHRNGEYRNDK